MISIRTFAPKPLSPSMKCLLRATFGAALLLAAAACEDPTGVGPPDRVQVSGGGDQSGPAGSVLGEPVTVTVTDDDGDPVAGVEVRFSVVSGGGFVDPGVDSTDARGVASTSWRLGPASADSQKVQVDVVHPVTGEITTSTIVRATATPLTGFRVLAVSGTGQTAATGARLADSLTARVVDELGNGVPGMTLTWEVSPYGGTVSPTTTVTRADGTARVAWTLGFAQGQSVVRATASGLTPAEFTAAGTSAFTINVTQPRADRQYGDSLPIVATAHSTTGGIVRMTARVEGRETNLSAGQGTLNLAGLTEGRKTFLLVAVSSAGDSSGVAYQITYNRPPQLTVSGPPRYGVIRGPSVRIDADCVDPSGCTRVAVYVSTSEMDVDAWRQLVAEGTASFHGDAPVAAHNGQRRFLHVEARDALGGRSLAVLGPFFIESTPTWTEIASGGYQALDADATRLLYADSAGGVGRVMVRGLAGGTPTELLAVPAGDEVEEGYLFPGGAIFATRRGIYEWRGGAAAKLASITNVFSPLEVAGQWAVWEEAGTVYRRSLATGTTAVVVSGAPFAGAHVAANGDVAYRAADGEVYLWREGAVTPVSNGLGGAMPVTDGTQVVFMNHAGSIYAWRGSPTLLSTLSPGGSRHSTYEAYGGWAAFVRADAGGIGHVWTMAPDGTVRQVSSGPPSGIAALGPAGETVFVRPANNPNLTRRYLAVPPYTAQPLDVGGYLGRMWFEGTQLYVALGRSIFRVTY